MEETLGDRIRWARLRRRLTQTDLAHDIHISTNAMNQIERNLTDPRASRVTAIAKTLGVSADYLLGLSDEEVPREAVALGTTATGRAPLADDPGTGRTRSTHSAPAPPPTPRPRRTRQAAPVG